MLLLFGGEEVGVDLGCVDDLDVELLLVGGGRSQFNRSSSHSSTPNRFGVGAGNSPAVKSVSASSAVAKNSSKAACSVIDPNSFWKSVVYYLPANQSPESRLGWHRIHIHATVTLLLDSCPPSVLHQPRCSVPSSTPSRARPGFCSLACPWRDNSRVFKYRYLL